MIGSTSLFNEDGLIEKNNMKKKVIVCLILVCVVVGFMAVITYLIPLFSRANDDDWYLSEINEIVTEYIEKGDFPDDRIRIYRYVYDDYDKEISIRNQSSENKEYPFTKMQVYVEIGIRDYIFYISKSESGDLEVTKHEYYKG